MFPHPSGNVSSGPENDESPAQDGGASPPHTHTLHLLLSLALVRHLGIWILHVTARSVKAATTPTTLVAIGRLRHAFWQEAKFPAAQGMVRVRLWVRNAVLCRPGGSRLLN